jgi:peptidoglycan/xylan/chitin deacetylase (PgdA/CDA1 family)
MPGYTRRFRFPYLKEGNTREKRDGFRAFLDSNDYTTAPVSVDTSDWYYSNRLRDRLKLDPQADCATATFTSTISMTERLTTRAFPTTCSAAP